MYILKLIAEDESAKYNFLSISYSKKSVPADS